MHTYGVCIANAPVLISCGTVYIYVDLCERMLHIYKMKSSPTHNAFCLDWVGYLFSCNVHCETPICCLCPPQTIRTVAVYTLWSPGALVLHTAPATQQASICDAGTAVSEVGALLHWETVDLGEGVEEGWRKTDVKACVLCWNTALLVNVLNTCIRAKNIHAST